VHVLVAFFISNKEFPRLTFVGASSKNLKYRIRFIGEFWSLFNGLLIQKVHIFGTVFSG
jgi:hypothetical protein